MAADILSAEHPTKADKADISRTVAGDFDAAGGGALCIA
jgi:hypothetical protein